MNSNFCIETECRFYIEGCECIEGDALDIELEDGSILKRVSFEGAGESWIIVDFYGTDVEIGIENILSIEKVQ